MFLKKKYLTWIDHLAIRSFNTVLLFCPRCTNSCYIDQNWWWGLCHPLHLPHSSDSGMEQPAINTEFGLQQELKQKIPLTRVKDLNHCTTVPDFSFRTTPSVWLLLIKFLTNRQMHHLFIHTYNVTVCVIGWEHEWIDHKYNLWPAIGHNQAVSEPNERFPHLVHFEYTHMPRIYVSVINAIITQVLYHHVLLQVHIFSQFMNEWKRTRCYFILYFHFNVHQILTNIYEWRMGYVWMGFIHRIEGIIVVYALNPMYKLLIEPVSDGVNIMKLIEIWMKIVLLNSSMCISYH